MYFKKLKIEGLVEIIPERVIDSRGYFSETFRKDKLEKHLKHEVNFLQENASMSKKNVFRGMHFQIPPYEQSKLISVNKGKILDMVLDIRKDSPTYCELIKIVLDYNKGNQLFVPRGFAHGFVVLSETATFAYKCDNYYMPEYDRGILFNDEALKIDWKISESEMKLSEKDSEQPLLKDAELFDFNNNLYE